MRPRSSWQTGPPSTAQVTYNQIDQQLDSYCDWNYFNRVKHCFSNHRKITFLSLRCVLLEGTQCLKTLPTDVSQKKSPKYNITYIVNHYLVARQISKLYNYFNGRKSDFKEQTGGYQEITQTKGKKLKREPDSPNSLPFSKSTLIRYNKHSLVYGSTGLRSKTP